MSWLEPSRSPSDAGADPDEGDEPDEEREPGGEREEAGPMDGVRPRMTPFLRRDQLDRGRQRLEVIAGLRHRDEARLAVDGTARGSEVASRTRFRPWSLAR